ncbi:MAG: hypothetical protein C5B50_08595 [Verrucomicrobia bacterium]|nr:MAG: hypothetical protein C5B50_08595 [Verrucomicrobiota bacterium]
MRAHRVRALLMGGQACVFYGAAEFSRDTDLAILCEPANLARLQRALAELRAEAIALPPFEAKYLRRGHAIHFRCHHPEALAMRVDVMSKMRSVDPFSRLWKRRTTIELPDGSRCDLLSLPDLVRAKKTQRDKDWPMVRRLVEAHYFQNRDEASGARVRFWLLELRTPEILIQLAQTHVRLCRSLIKRRPLLPVAIGGDHGAVERALEREERKERESDRGYWLPLRKELDRLRHERLARLQARD